MKRKITWNGLKKCMAGLLAFSMVFGCMQSFSSEASEGDTQTTVQTTRSWDFSSAEQINDFDLYTNKKSTLTVKDGVMKQSYYSTAAADSTSGTEMKAILKNVTGVTNLSVDITTPPVTSAITAAVYLGVSNPSNNANVITTLACELERDTRGGVKFGFARWNQTWGGWYVGNTTSDTTMFSATTNFQMVVDIYDGVVVARLIDKDNPEKYLVRVYDCAADNKDYITSESLATGNIGFRLQNNLSTFDNLKVVTSNDGEKWDFSSADQMNDFSNYKYTGNNSAAEVVVADGVMKLSEPTSSVQIKTILDGVKDVTSVSMDLIPPAYGTPFASSVFIGASNPKDAKDTINSLAIMIEGDSAGKIKFGIASYNDGWGGWKVGNSWNEFFADSSDTLHIVINRYGNLIVATLMQGSNYLQVTYDATEYSNALANGTVGLKFYNFSDSYLNSIVAFDNLQVVYNAIDKTELNATIEEAKALTESDYTPESWSAFQTALANAQTVAGNTDATRAQVQAAIDTLNTAAESLEKAKAPEPITKIYDFESVTQALDFDFFHSSNGGFGISNGKLVSNETLGEFKAMLRGINRSYSSASVDIYPGEDGKIDAGIYIGASNAAHQAQCIDGLIVGVDTKMNEGELQLDLFIGNYPVWKTLARKNLFRSSGLITSEGYQPMNLKVEMEGNKITATLSLISDPSVAVTLTHEYTGSYDLAQGQVGLRSNNCKNTLDNFKVVYNAEGNTNANSNNNGNGSDNGSAAPASPQTGDSVNVVLWGITVVLSLGALILMMEKKRRKA